MQNNPAQDAVNSAGAIAEMGAIHFNTLVKQGLSRKEALELTQTFTSHQMQMTRDIANDIRKQKRLQTQK